MIRFAPNFYHMFLEIPIQQRFVAAAKIGITSIEWHFPYELHIGRLTSAVQLYNSGIAVSLSSAFPKASRHVRIREIWTNVFVEIVIWFDLNLFIIFIIN